jgi:Arc/MetJ-type ribon-helix-helix transcriptional regulator
MFGFFIGTACLIGLVGVARRGHHRRHFGYGGWRHGRGGFGVRFLLRRVLERLDTTPGQEKVIREAVHQLEEDTVDLRSEMRGTRAALAQALRGPDLDKESIDRVFARHDDVIEKLRASLLETAEKVHVTLDERQRRQLADMIESGPYGYAGC